MIMRWFMMAVAIVVFSNGHLISQASPLLRDPNTDGARPCQLDCTMLHLRLNPEDGSCPLRAADCGKCLPGYEEHFLDSNGKYEDCSFIGHPDDNEEEEDEFEEFDLAMTPMKNSHDLEVLNTSPKTTPYHRKATEVATDDPPATSAEERGRQSDKISAPAIVVMVGVVCFFVFLLLFVRKKFRPHSVTCGNPQKLPADDGPRLIRHVQEVPLHVAHQPAHTNLPKQCVGAGADEKLKEPLFPSTTDISGQIGADGIHHQQDEGEEDVCAGQDDEDNYAVRFLRRLVQFYTVVFMRTG